VLRLVDTWLAASAARYRDHISGFVQDRFRRVDFERIRNDRGFGTMFAMHDGPASPGQATTDALVWALGPTFKAALHAAASVFDDAEAGPESSEREALRVKLDGEIIGIEKQIEALRHDAESAGLLV
jgi:hypothetical protein